MLSCNSCGAEIKGTGRTGLCLPCARRRSPSLATRKKRSVALMGNKNSLGCHPSDETRSRISIAITGPKNPMFGKRHSKKTRRKMSRAKVGNKYALGCRRSDETKRKLSEARIGVPNPSAAGNKYALGCHHSKKTRARQRAANLGTRNPNYGKSPSEETLVKMRTAALGNQRALGNHFTHREEALKKMSLAQSGPNHSNWQGGISYEPYAPEFNQPLKDRIRWRDNFICQFPGCGLAEAGRHHHVHHIDYDKKNNCESNLILLCNYHNVVVNGSRQQWTKYFQAAADSRECEGTSA